MDARWSRTDHAGRRAGTGRGTAAWRPDVPSGARLYPRVRRGESAREVVELPRPAQLSQPRRSQQ